MQGVAARLLAEPGFLARFQQAPDATLQGFDLTETERRALLALDLSRLGMVCEGYAGKRAERVESAFPWTLRALGPQAKEVVKRHLAAFPTGGDEGAELAAFAECAAREASPEWRARLVQDLIDAESALRASSGRSARNEGARWGPALILRLSPGVALVRTRGDLASALAAGDAVQDHPESPGDALVRSTSRGIIAERLTEEDAALLRACLAGATVGEAAREAEGEARLRRWYAAGVLEPALRPAASR